MGHTVSCPLINFHLTIRRILLLQTIPQYLDLLLRNLKILLRTRNTQRESDRIYVPWEFDKTRVSSEPTVYQRFPTGSFDFIMRE